MPRLAALPRPAARSPIVLLGWTALALAGVLAWDASALDLAAARWFGDQHGFPLRDHWLLSAVLHEGGRAAAWLLALGLCVGAWWPVGPLRRIGMARRLQLAGSTLAAVLAVSLMKGFSLTSCPWELDVFGRTAHLVSHWAWLHGPDGGSGHCFPAGHASAGFAFLGGFFAFRTEAPHIARRWLAAALAAGFVFGAAQQARGAHFMSHTLWTAWLCWSVALAIDLAVRRRMPAPLAREST
ncbi:phosphatase PAP2 family protein [Aquincola sp. MAHUQ-54]|uniref:Phosphatase PAP2 family protein n=1 Tax=Aquincola agrisoli TaxID=3119538 RepID=A0AAW9QHK5_9BURK